MKKDKEHTVVFQPAGIRGKVADGKTLLEASRELGADIEGICGGKAACGKCMIRIENGFFEKYGIESKPASVSPVSGGDRKLLSKQQIRNRYRLACQTHVHGDIVVFVPEESRKGKQVIRKEATIRDIKLKPAVKKYHLELRPATLHDSLGDFERLQTELLQQFKLRELTIDYPVLLNLQNMVRQGDWKVTVSIWNGKEIINIESGNVANAYGLAVDIGTTTVAGYLCDLRSGNVVATNAIMNPQVAFGEDVMSRISYSVKNKTGLKQMNQAIIRGLNQITQRVAVRAGVRCLDIIDMTVVGNTCMHHLFLNIDPIHLGKTPFTPSLHHSIDIKARDLGLKISPGAYVHMLPIEAGFVGADNVGVLIAEEPYNQDEMVLIIDIGTNGELILGNRNKLFSASCATGPAFEGAEIKHGMRAAPGAIEKLEIDNKTKEVRFKVIGNKHWNTEVKNIGAKGICGSGIFDVTAQMFLTGLIDKGGRFNSNIKSPRLRQNDKEPEFVVAWARETSINRDITVCQSDIRAVQLAKGAVYAGARILMNRLGVSNLDKVILAGAFGSYIDKESAAVIGLFPDCAPENVIAVGNAAGDGARIALLNVDKRKEANVMARQVGYVELTLEPDFNKVFTQAMVFPNMVDEFPHLEHLLPKSEQFKINVKKIIGGKK